MVMGTSYKLTYIGPKAIKAPLNHYRRYLRVDGIIA